MAQKLKPAMPRQHRSKVLKRQFIEHAAQHGKQTKQQRKLQIRAFVYGGAVSLVAAGAVLLISGMHTPGSQPPVEYKVATLGVSTDRNATPDETPITTGAMLDYKVPDSQPRLLRIPKLQIVSRVLSVGTNINKEPLTPTNIFDAGWLNTTPIPGDAGAALMIGAVAGPTKAGIFANIINLGVGDEIQVESGDGKVHTFKVAKSQSYPADKVDLAAATKSAVAGRPGLNLLTATGRFNVKDNRFEPRTVIFAVKN
jgi:hypothetical protein